MQSFTRARALACIVACLLGAACNRGSAPAAERRPRDRARNRLRRPATPDESGHPKIVVLGDSLSAGFGLLEMQAFPALLQTKLNQDGYKWDVVNAGISGDTSAAGLQRVDVGARPG